MKTIEVKEVVAVAAGGAAVLPDFREAWLVQRVVDATLSQAVSGAGCGLRRSHPYFREAWLIQRVVDAALLSGRERRWVRVDEIG